MRDSNNLPFNAKLFMHTLRMTLLIIIINSFQTMGHDPAPEPEYVPASPPETEFPPVQLPESHFFNSYDEIQDDYDRGDPAPGRGPGAVAGPIPHPELDDEVADIDLLA